MIATTADFAVQTAMPCVTDFQRNEITLTAVKTEHKLGFRTFVLQGGEDGFFTDDVMCDIVSEIKNRFPDCAVTLSLGERSYESYQRLFDSGADRYLLRHETADKKHYSCCIRPKLSLENRMQCLYNLKRIGYQTGAGFMVGSPFQTPEMLVKDLKFIEKLSPEMCGIGPFVPHKDTKFKNENTWRCKPCAYVAFNK